MYLVCYVVDLILLFIRGVGTASKLTTLQQLITIRPVHNLHKLGEIIRPAHDLYKLGEMSKGSSDVSGNKDTGVRKHSSDGLVAISFLYEMVGT